jgi:hypothetical protein
METEEKRWGGGRNGKEKSHESRNGKTPGRNRNELAQSIVSGLLDQISRKKGGQKKSPNFPEQ